MTTYREAIYMCLDLLKGMSDDFTYTEEHIAYLLDKNRAMLLKQLYGKDPKKHVPYSNYQTLEIPLSKDDNDLYISNTPLPIIMQVGIPRITTDTYYNTKVNFVSRERFPFVNHNKFIKMDYCTLDQDNFLLYKAQNTDDPDITIKLTALFENPKEIAYNNSILNVTEYLEEPIPIEETLITQLIDTTVKLLVNSVNRPTDNVNNASDDTAYNLAAVRSKTNDK